jgi:hypothetical protein
MATKEQKVSIDLYDITGRLIKKEYQGALHPRKNTFNFSLNGLPDGVYFYRIANNQNSSFVKTLKISR